MRHLHGRLGALRGYPRMLIVRPEWTSHQRYPEDAPLALWFCLHGDDVAGNYSILCADIPHQFSVVLTSSLCMAAGTGVAWLTWLFIVAGGGS